MSNDDEPSTAAAGADGAEDPGESNGTARQKEEENSASIEGGVKRSVRLLFIRHAESQNNEVYRAARHLYRGGTPDFDLDGWNAYVDANRRADPGLSDRGKVQADRLGKYLVRHLGRQASRPVRVVTSPMKRTIESLLPALGGLLRSIEENNGDADASPAASVTTNAFYHESEGCHIRERAYPGMNPAEIASLLNSGAPPSDCSPPPLSFVGFDPEDASAGWYAHGTGPETRAESESRAAKFYLWLCEDLDSQLREAERDSIGDVFDAGVSEAGEEEDDDHDHFQVRRRRRRTCVLFGHGDFMSLVLKRIVSGFGHSVETEGVPHRSAFVHFNTGITELEYFGGGRFLLMAHNQAPHLNRREDVDLKTGGSLKDGWSYLMPDGKSLLDTEVSVAFSDELERHVREQAEALRDLYLRPGRRSSLKGKGRQRSSDNEDDVVASPASDEFGVLASFEDRKSVETR